LSERVKKVGLIMPTHICTYDPYPENLVKIGPGHTQNNHTHTHTQSYEGGVGS